MIDYLLIYILGFISPFLIQKMLIPKLKVWVAENAENWKLTKKRNPQTKRKRCPECDSPGRHKKTCSRGKKK